MRPEVAEYARKVKGAILIPRGTPMTPCNGPRCNENVFFVGKQPVSIEPYHNAPRGEAPTATQDGIGVSHFANCIDAAMFRRKK